MRKRLESVWAVGVEWLHFLYFAVTRGEKGNGNEGKRHQSDGRSRPEDFFFFCFLPFKGPFVYTDDETEISEIRDAVLPG